MSMLLSFKAWLLPSAGAGRGNGPWRSQSGKGSLGSLVVGSVLVLLLVLGPSGSLTGPGLSVFQTRLKFECQSLVGLSMISWLL